MSGAPLGRSEEEVTFPPERRRRMQSSLRQQRKTRLETSQSGELSKLSGGNRLAHSRITTKGSPASAHSSAQCSQNVPAQASWLMATNDVPPPSHPIRAVAYSSASLRTLTGGRLTNYSGGPHRIHTGFPFQPARLGSIICPGTAVHEPPAGISCLFQLLTLSVYQDV